MGVHGVIPALVIFEIMKNFEIDEIFYVPFDHVNPNYIKNSLCNRISEMKTIKTPFEKPNSHPTDIGKRFFIIIFDELSNVLINAI